MLDVEFLQRNSVKSHVVHLYEHGSLRAEVGASLRQIAEAKGWFWQVLDPTAPSMGSGGVLYDAVLIEVDLDAVLAQADAAQTVAAIAHKLTSGRETHFYLHGRGGGPLNEWEAWDSILHAATVLHEPQPSPSALPKLMAYLEPHLTVRLGQVTNRPDLDLCLREWVAQGDLTLPQFLSRLDVLLTTCTDDAGVFDAAGFRAAIGGGATVAPTHWALPLARFLRSKSNQDRHSLLAAVDRAVNRDGMDARTVLAAVRRASFDLAKSNSATNPGAGVIPDGWSSERWEQYRAHQSLRLPVVMVWQTLLLHHEPTLISHGLTGWSQLLRVAQGGTVGRR